MMEQTTIRITIGDLVYINEAARNLKQKVVMWIGNKLVGLDSNDYIVFINLDPSKLSIIPQRGLIFSQRDLSKFMKSISTESGFDVCVSGMIFKTQLNTISDSMMVEINESMQRIVDAKINNTMYIDQGLVLEEDISNNIKSLYSMARADGMFKFIYDNNHYMTLFPGLLPLNKSDKVYMCIDDQLYGQNSFVSRFRVHKKQFDVFVYVRYLTLIGWG